MSQATLLLCPFCGVRPYVSMHFIGCVNADCKVVVRCVTEAEWNTRAPHPAIAALLAVEKLFATPGYYIGTREGADPLAIDATMLLVAQAVRAAKGEQ